VRDCRSRVSPLIRALAAVIALGSLLDGGSTLAAGSACFTVAGTDPVDLLVSQPSPERRPGSEPGGPIPETEVGLLMNALERVPLKEGGWTIRGVTEGTKLPVERLQRLVGDVRAVLAELNGRELLDRLRTMRGVGRADLRELEDRFTNIGRCTRDRFESRDAYRQTQQVVSKQRAKLASLVLEPLEGGIPPAKDDR
jgi:hypothetical protein